MHRKHLKAYNVDLSTISENSINSMNRYKAETHPIWQHISDSYQLKDFLALDMPLERLKRKNYAYTVADAIKEQVAIARKFYVHGGVVDERHFEEVLEAFQKSKESKYITTQSVHNEDNSKEVVITYETISEHVNLRELNNLELEKYIKTLESYMLKPDLDLHVLIKKHQLAYIELEFRGKAQQQEFPF